MKYLWKGDLVDLDDVKIDLQDRGYQFGDGIYEFVRVYNGKLFRLEDHLDRFELSARLIDMKLPYSREEMRKFSHQLVEENQLVSGNIYIQITRGDGIARRHNYPLFAEQKGVISGFISSYDRPTEKIEQGETAILYPDLRWQLCNAKTLNLLANCMAISEAKKVGADKAILHRDNLVTEERAGNVLIVKDGRVITRPDGPEILPGITKKVGFEIMKAKNIPYEERTFTVDELLAADEVIVTDTKTEFCPILQIDGKVIGSGKRGPMAAKLDEGYKELIVQDCGSIT